MADRQLNATAASLLGFLHDGPLSGYELAATAQQVIGDFWSLTQSQVYRELASMTDAGLVERGEPEQRDRRRYTLTDAGRAAFDEWMRRVPGPESIRHPLLLALRFGRHVPSERLSAYLRQHRDAHAEKLRTYEEQAGALDSPSESARDPYQRATLAFGVAYERAVMDWFAQLPGIIGQDDG
ncbi:MAG: PadR family transcriptional regulator [Candidatus Limnocylindria bacterium]